MYMRVCVCVCVIAIERRRSAGRESGSRSLVRPTQRAEPSGHFHVRKLRVNKA